MKKNYESPRMIVEGFIAEQNIAGNCQPGIKESESSVQVTCAPGTLGLMDWLIRIINAIFGTNIPVNHKHGTPVSTTVFTSNCETYADESNMVNGMILVTWGDGHVGSISNSGTRPYYFTS